MKYYRIEALVGSEFNLLDNDGEVVQNAVESIDVDLVVKDLSVYEVAHLPGHGHE